MGLLDELIKYIKDVAPGGLLNPETAPVAAQAQYLSGLLDPKSQVSKDAQAWHKRTQVGLQDQLSGRDTPEAEAAYQTMMQAAGIAPVGMIAWHGSPHKFDKFSLDKIGTGEGKTQQGVGAYLSETQGIGQRYADRLADMHGKDAGFLYKTDLPDEAIAKFANYDASLSENPQNVRDAISQMVNDDVMHNLRGYYGWESHHDAPVAAIMGAMDIANGNSRQITSDQLKKAGIPGIRYLDGGSRGTGTGTSNFVVFDPEMIRILERNGQATGLQPWKSGEYQGLLR